MIAGTETRDMFRHTAVHLLTVFPPEILVLRLNLQQSIITWPLRDHLLRQNIEQQLTVNRFGQWPPTLNSTRWFIESLVFFLTMFSHSIHLIISTMSTIRNTNLYFMFASGTQSESFKWNNAHMTLVRLRSKPLGSTEFCLLQLISLRHQSSIMAGMIKVWHAVKQLRVSTEKTLTLTNPPILHAHTHTHRQITIM